MDKKLKKEIKNFLYILLISMLCVVAVYNEKTYKAELLFALFLIAFYLTEISTTLKYKGDNK